MAQNTYFDLRLLSILQAPCKSSKVLTRVQNKSLFVANQLCFFQYILTMGILSRGNDTTCCPWCRGRGHTPVHNFTLPTFYKRTSKCNLHSNSCPWCRDESHYWQKKSLTGIQILGGNIEMIAFPPTDNPWSCWFQEVFVNTILSSREVDQRADLFNLKKTQQ